MSSTDPRDIQGKGNLSSQFDQQSKQTPARGAPYHPNVTEEDKNGREYLTDVFSKMYQRNAILVQGGVDEHMATSIVAQIMLKIHEIEEDNAASTPKTEAEIMEMSEADREAYAEHRKLLILIDSPGGYCSEGLRIVDAMMQARNKGVVVETVVNGIAMSMGSVILTAGTPGFRKCWPHSEIMLHMASGGAQGTARDATISIDELNFTNENLKAWFRTSTTMTEEQLAQCFDVDSFMRGEEALDKGIINKVTYPENLGTDYQEYLKYENMRHWHMNEERRKAKHVNTHWAPGKSMLLKPE